MGEWLDGSPAGTNFLDVSGYPLATNHGAFLVGAGKFVFTNDVPPGRTGQSLFLYNGDTGLAISNSSTLDANYDDTFDNQITNAFTIEFWAKGWPSAWNPFVSKYGETFPSSSGGWQFRADAAIHPCWTMRGAGGLVTLGTADGGNPDDLAASSVTFGNDGGWHFYVGNFDASKKIRELYVDNQLVAAETNVTAYWLASLEHVCIGARDSNGSQFGSFFTGQIYDVRIYNYSMQALSCAIPLGIVTKNVDVSFGQTVQLTSFASANPAPNLGYGWTSNGVPVPNANTNILTISNVTANATYDFIITNQCDETYAPEIFNVNVIPAAVTNLVGRWFSGAQTLADVSGYQPAGTHDGYDAGNPGGSYYFTNDVPPGRLGYSLYLSNDGIFITNSSTVDAAYTNTFDETIHGAVTVAFWAKGWPGQWNPWVSKYGEVSPTPGGGWQIRDSGNNANAAWTMRGTGGTVSPGTAVFGNPEELRGTNFSNDGRWHAYVGTYSFVTGIRSLYVDGVLSGQSAGNHLYALAPQEHLCIGAKDSPPGGSFGNFFTGKIYDVRISGYSWNTNEVAVYSAVPDPLIYSQPPPFITNYVGGNVQIIAGTSGATPLTNQWQFNGTNLMDGFYGSTFVNGSRSNILTIYTLTTNFQGTYRLTISNANGIAISSNAALTVLAAPPLNPNSRMVGAWITGPANLSDSSGYSPAGTHDGYGVQGIDTLSSHYAFTNDVPPGMTGQSLVLFGDTAIAISNSCTLDAGYTNTFDDTLTNAMTVVFWAKGWPSSQWNPWLSKYGENSQGWQLRRNAGTNFSVWTIRGTGGQEDMAATIASNDGKWHQYAGTYDFANGLRNLFIDGLQAASQSGEGAYTMAPSSHLVLGGRDNGGNSFGSYFAGEIYGVRLYNYATNFVHGFPIPVPPGPIPQPIQSSNKLVLTWGSGSLEQAPTPAGPWTPTGATSPYTNDVSTAAQMFFRLSYP